MQARRQNFFLHLYFSCRESQNIWNKLTQHIKDQLNIDLIFSKNVIILGYLHTDNRTVAINSILLAIRAYIFGCASTGKKLNFPNAMLKVKDVYDEQYLIYVTSDKLKSFEKMDS